LGPFKTIENEKKWKNKLGELEAETIIELTQSDLSKVKGGFLSIFSCGARFGRYKHKGLWTKCRGDTNGDAPGGECAHNGILNMQG